MKLNFVSLRNLYVLPLNMDSDFPHEATLTSIYIHTRIMIMTRMVEQLDCLVMIQPESGLIKDNRFYTCLYHFLF